MAEIDDGGTRVVGAFFPVWEQGRHHSCFFQFATGVEEIGWSWGGRHGGRDGERRPKGGWAHGGWGGSQVDFKQRRWLV
jgi:hypothetical protein